MNSEPGIGTPYMPFRVLIAGDWRPGYVRSVTGPNTRAIVPAVEAAIDQAWAAAKARPGALLFDGPMCRLQSWSVDGDDLTLHLADSSYKPFFGTNISHPEFVERFGPSVMADPVGVSPAVVTSDGHLVLGRRNQSVAYYPGRVHPFAGCLEPGDRDVFAAVIRELSEELTVRPDDVVDLTCTGVVAELNLKQTELIFAAEVTQTRSDLVARLDTAEHAATWSIPATPHDVARVVTHPDALLTPVAVASLLLWGRLRFGLEWYQRLSAGSANPI